MATSPISAPPALADVLPGVVAAIGRGPDLERVLPSIVELLTEATGCHACFVYLLDGDRLRVRAASRVFAHAVGVVEFGLDEGICGWVARHRTPALITDNALADPRMKLVPELHEERFQSMVAVPLERGDDVIGVVVLHTEAPREFNRNELGMLQTVATLVSGAIDNARLYEETHEQVVALRELVELGRALAAVTRQADLAAALRVGIARMLSGAAGRLRLGAADPGGSVHDPARGSIAVAIGTSAAPVGFVEAVRGRPFRIEHVRMVEAVAAQLAVSIERLALIDELRGELETRELFAALDARALPPDPTLIPLPFVAVVARCGPALEHRLRASYRDVRSHADGDLLRVLVGVPGRDLERLTAILGADAGASAGCSLVYEDPAAAGRALREATIALRMGGRRGAPAVQAYADLGALRFLAGVDPHDAPDPRYERAVRALRDYDERRRAPLVETLERYLESAQGIAPLSRELHIHPNTLRQRLDRIEAVTGLELSTVDRLSLLLALKLEQLRPA